MQSLHLVVKGTVQGVYFRASAKTRADELGVVGWVKNTREGHVEILATGNDYAINEFVNWCRVGPTHAVVSTIDIEKMDLRLFNEFSITH
jgi:acylphosphatase